MSLPASLHLHVVVFQKISTFKKRVGQWLNCEPGEDRPAELCWIIFLDNQSVGVKMNLPAEVNRWRET